MWVVTVQNCIYTMSPSPATSAKTVTTDTASTWQEYIVALDISSFSAMILALLFTRWAFVGGRNTIRYFQRDGRAYFRCAYHSVLFTEGFETLCIRMGLLGTLLSFVLAALIHMSGEPLTSGGASIPTAADQVAQIAQESTETTEGTANATPSQLPSLRISRVHGKDLRPVVCKPRVHVCGHPVRLYGHSQLNWLNERAIGLHQIVQADPRLAADEFFREVALTSQRLAQFETTTAKLTESVSTSVASKGTWRRLQGVLDLSATWMLPLPLQQRGLPN